MLLHNGNTISRNSIPAKIVLKGNKIYNNGIFVGTFDQKIMADSERYSFYDENNILLFKATHILGDDTADWKVNHQDNTTIIFYNKENAFENLCADAANAGIFE